MNTETYFALNTKTKHVTQLNGFSCWEHVQSAFSFGIVLPNGIHANGIGRCTSPALLVQKAKHSGYSVVMECGCDRWNCAHGNGAMA